MRLTTILLSKGRKKEKEGKGRKGEEKGGEEKGGKGREKC